MPPVKRKQTESTTISSETGRAAASVSTRKKQKRCADELVAAAKPETNPHIWEPKGLLRLPVELHEEILGYLKHPTLRTIVGLMHVPVIPPKFTERNKVLRVLASICVAYRRMFLPLAWSHVLVCSIGKKDNPVSYYKTLGDMLARKCKGLKENPELGVHVRKISVILTRYKHPVLLPLLASCLEGLPNLHTFHIYHAPVDLTSFIQQAFEDVVLKSINTVVVPDYCHEILRSCPNVIKVQSTDGTGSKLVGAIMDCCPHVETLIGINVSGTVVKRLVKAAPNLRILHLKYPPVSDLALLAPLKKLEVLKVDMGPSRSQLMEERRESARKVLASMPPLPSGKKRQLWYTRDEERELRYKIEVLEWRRKALQCWLEEIYDSVEYI